MTWLALLFEMARLLGWALLLAVLFVALERHTSIRNKLARTE
jgi:hypothetical protein